MDGFDDLLAPSRQALESNPFADAFGDRSSSPDPWATPFSSHDVSENAFGDLNTSEHFASAETSYATGFTNTPSHPTEEVPLSDPLDSAVHNASEEDDDDKPLANFRSPGFRESVQAGFSETATIRPEHVEEFESTTAPSTLPSGEPITPTPQPDAFSTQVNPPPSHTATQSIGGFAPPLSASESALKSPLDPFPSIERSVAALSLGGEAVGGWQTEDQSPWGSERFTPTQPVPPPTEDDSDDDKPILQAYKHLDSEGKSTTVSVF